MYLGPRCCDVGSAITLCHRCAALEAALATLGIDQPETLRPLSRSLVATLLLGGVGFTSGAGDGDETSEGARVETEARVGALELVARALAVDIVALEKALCVRQLSVRRDASFEILETPHTATQAVAARDALAKVCARRLSPCALCARSSHLLLHGLLR